MFTRTAVAHLARLASLAVEGEGQGHTIYAQSVTPRRYIVGGVGPALILPIGEARASIRIKAWDMAHTEAATAAHTMGYWEDGGSVYVDLGDTWYSLDIALDVARARGEKAIYDRQTGECIPVA